jgi:hypothetical protein
MAASRHQVSYDTVVAGSKMIHAAFARETLRSLSVMGGLCAKYGISK